MRSKCDRVRALKISISESGKISLTVLHGAMCKFKRAWSCTHLDLFVRRGVWFTLRQAAHFDSPHACVLCAVRLNYTRAAIQTTVCLQFKGTVTVKLLHTNIKVSLCVYLRSCDFSLRWIRHLQSKKRADRVRYQSAQCLIRKKFFHSFGFLCAGCALCIYIFIVTGSACLRAAHGLCWEKNYAIMQKQ